jgi:hypothetical protein
MPRALHNAAIKLEVSRPRSGRLLPGFAHLICTKLFTMARFTQLAALLACASLSTARKPSLEERGIPKDPEGVRTITSPQGAQIRFKQPGKDGGICETTEGVDDYAGYISLNEKYNMFFWFFEARENPSEKPVSIADNLPGLHDGLTIFS